MPKLHKVDEVHCIFGASEFWREDVKSWSASGGRGPGSPRPKKAGRRGLHTCKIIQNGQEIYQGIMSKVILPNVTDVSWDKETGEWSFILNEARCSLRGYEGKPAELDCTPQED